MEIGIKEKFQTDFLKWIQAGIYTILIYGIYTWSLHALVIYDWQRDGYSYGYLIPLVILFLVWLKKDEFRAVESKPSWWGMLILLPGLLLFWLGELAGELLTLYLSMWLVLIGLCWLHFGWRKLKVIGFPLFFILTMFPLPVFLNNKIMLQLRLISSKIGVALIQLFGIPVNRHGNIIDLGFVQLQVVEACSGLHSMISLVVLCLLFIYFFKAHLWKRLAILLSSIPLAIFANSMRIALTAIFHKYFGAEIAQGFFHGFSGLVIFIICIPVLFLVMKILEKLPPDSQKPSTNSSDIKKDNVKNVAGSVKDQISQGAVLCQPIFIVSVILLLATFAFSHTIEFREKIPAKKSLDNFPTEFSGWVSEGRQTLDQIYIDALNFSEYTMADFKNKEGRNVSLYLAYYESQKKGQSIHSPASCLPGSGWSFDSTSIMSMSDIPGYVGTMKVNRAVMQFGDATQIAYFWFSQRGRVLNNAYQLKIYNFWDALTMQRTDGALIRLITPVYKNETLDEVDSRLQDFVRAFVPVLNDYIPGREIADST